MLCGFFFTLAAKNWQTFIVNKQNGLAFSLSCLASFRYETPQRKCGFCCEPVFNGRCLVGSQVCFLVVDSLNSFVVTPCPFQSCVGSWKLEAYASQRTVAPCKVVIGLMPIVTELFHSKWPDCW